MFKLKLRRFIEYFFYDFFEYKFIINPIFFMFSFLFFVNCKQQKNKIIKEEIDHHQTENSELKSNIKSEIKNFVILMNNFKSPGDKNKSLELVSNSDVQKKQNLTLEEQKKLENFVKKDLEDVESGAHGWTEEKAEDLFYSPAFDGLKEESRAFKNGKAEEGSWFSKIPSRFREKEDGSGSAQTTLYGSVFFIGLAAVSLYLAKYDKHEGDYFSNFKDRKMFSRVAYGRSAIGFGLGFGMLSLAYAGYRGLMSQEEMEKTEGVMTVIDGTTLALLGVAGVYESTKNGKNFSQIHHINPTQGETDNKDHWAIEGHLSQNMAYTVGMVGLIGFGLSYAAYGSYNLAKASESEKKEDAGFLPLISEEGQENFFQKLTNQMDKLFVLHDQWTKT